MGSSPSCSSLARRQRQKIVDSKSLEGAGTELLLTLARASQPRSLFKTQLHLLSGERQKEVNKEEGKK